MSKLFLTSETRVSGVFFARTGNAFVQNIHKTVEPDGPTKTAIVMLVKQHHWRSPRGSLERQVLINAALKVLQNTPGRL